MAAEKARKKKKKSLFEDQPKAQGDLTALVEQIKENPALYLGAVIFIVACLIAGMLYRAHREAVVRDLYTAYAEAMENEDPQERLAALEPLIANKDSDPAMAEIVYVTAETAFWAEDYDKAKTLYERVRTEYPESQYVPNAVEGLAYIAEDGGDLDSALSSYREITQKWPTSFTARRQPLNVARVEEKQDNLKGAIESYREQTTVFPDSNVAQEAQAALDRLSKSNPALFAPADVSASDLSSIELPLSPTTDSTVNSAASPETSPPDQNAPAPAETTPTESTGTTPAPAEGATEPAPEAP